MILAVLINLAWILWSLYKFLTGFRMYTGISACLFHILFCGTSDVHFGVDISESSVFQETEEPMGQGGIGLVDYRNSLIRRMYLNGRKYPRQ